MTFDSFLLQAAEEGFSDCVVPAVTPAAHAGQQCIVFAPAVEVITGKLGVFNRSSQHLNLGGVYGTTRRVDEEVDGARSDALAGCAVAPA